jgi:uncharacterized membrane protein YfcA
LLLALTASAIGGAINSIAGGGTLVVFPAIVWLGVPPLVANATTTVALWPGSLGAMWAYRGELGGARSWAIRFAVPSLAGGATGALLLLHTSAERFEHIVPYLVLGATVLFMAQGPIMRHLRARGVGLGAPQAPQAPLSGAEAPPPRSQPARFSGAEAPPPQAPEVLAAPPAPYLLYQFAVGIYGGYFGAGIGILMLAVLGVMGLTNIHRMNGLKNWGALCINAMAAVLFAFSGIVSWTIAASMAVGGLIGGYAGASLAQRVRQIWVRRAIVGIGFGAFVWLLVR